MSKRLRKFTPLGGIAVDVPPHSLNERLFTGGQNVIFRPFAERVAGHRNVYGNLSTDVRALVNARIGGVNYWVYHGKTKSYAVQGATHTDITHAAGLTSVAALNRWSVGLLNGFPYANNQIDAPMYWDGNPANKFVTLPGWPGGTTCGALRAWGNFLFALNMSEPGGSFPEKLRWSNLAAAGAYPTSWTAAATNEAGDAILSDTPGSLIDAAPLGAGLAIYKSRAAYLAEYVRGNFVFQFRRLPITRGVLSLNCIADFKGRHFLVTEGDLVVTDGVTVESPANNRMRGYLFNQLDQTNYRSVFVAELKEQNEIWVCFPSAGNTFCDLALVWNWADDAWGVRELPAISCAAVGIVNDTAVSDTWDADAGTWDSDATLWNEQNFSEAQESLLIAAPNDATPAQSKLHQVDLGTDANGTAINALVGKYTMDFGDGSRVKCARRVYLYAKAPPGVVLYVRLGGQMSPDGTITWGAESTFTVGTDQYANIPFVSGRYLSIEIRSAGGQPWQLPAFDIEYEPRGYH